MDSFEVNKILGAVLSALLVVFGSRTLLDIALKEQKPERPGWDLPVTESSAEAKQEAPTAFDDGKVIGLLARANPDVGKDTFKRCQQCHTADKGGRNLVGPNLWGVVGRQVGHAQGFPYSDAMKSHGGEWTWEQLARYLHDPKAAVPGNKMAFPGIKDDAELADLLAYLRSLSDAPPALPG